MHIQSLAYSKLHKGKYYEQTKINGIEVIYVVDWLLPINLKTLKILTAFFVFNAYASTCFLIRAKESK